MATAGAGDASGSRFRGLELPQWKIETPPGLESRIAIERAYGDSAEGYGLMARPMQMNRGANQESRKTESRRKQ